MASANGNMQLVSLDFDAFKQNLKTFLKSQDTLKDYNYEGSSLAILLDLLSYNSVYLGYYLNMVANEMFLDSATKRSSVVSHAKLLGYTPSSMTAPTAVVDLDIKGLELSSIVIPKFTKFLSESIDLVNYTFVTTTEYVANTDENGDVYISGITLKQGEPLSYRFTYVGEPNSYAKFKIPDLNVDLDSLEVVVQNSNTDGYITIYNKPNDSLALDGTSEVYFIQEGMDGYYEIYFGNGIIGKKLTDGNVVILTYITTKGDVCNGAKSFVILDQPIASYDTLNVVTVQAASSGQQKESNEFIKYIAPKAYSAQERAVTVNDYITLIQKNSGSFPIDSVTVWSGEENTPPVYGKIFVAIKPKGGYTVTTNQKKRIIEEIISPISVLTITPEIVDVDYTYLNLSVDVLYDKSKTLLSAEILKSYIISSIKNYCNDNLNTFNSTFVMGDLINYINDSDDSIITNEPKVYLEKKFVPGLKFPETYTLDYGIPLKRDFFRKSISISPSIQIQDETANYIVRTEVFIEEVPSSASNIQEINIINPGFNYTSAPTITILGDGTGAEAEAEITNGKISKITLTNSGTNYTQVIVQISGGNGILGSATAILAGQYGTLRSYYFQKGIKYILNSNVGTVDYFNGTITLYNFMPYDVNNSLGILSVKAIPDTNIIYSKYNKLLTLNTDDPTSISVNLKIK
jgi:hypothetical protein